MSTPVCVPPLAQGRRKPWAQGGQWQMLGGGTGGTLPTVGVQGAAVRPVSPPRPPHYDHCRAWERRRGSLLPGDGGTAGRRGGMVLGGPPPHRTRGGHVAVGLGSSPWGGPKATGPPRPVVQVSPKRRSWGGLPVYPPFSPQYSSHLGRGASLPTPPSPVSKRGASSLSEGGVSCRGGGRTWGGGRREGGHAPSPPSVHHVTTRLTLDTDTNAGCPPPPKY